MRQWILTALALTVTAQVNGRDLRTTRGFEAHYILDRLGVQDDSIQPRISYTEIPNRPKHFKVFIETDTLHCTVTLRMIMGMFPLVNDEAKKNFKCYPILASADIENGNAPAVVDLSQVKTGTQTEIAKLKKILDRKRTILARKLRKLSQLEEDLAGDVGEFFEKNFHLSELRHDLKDKKLYLTRRRDILKSIEERLVEKEDLLDRQKKDAASEEDELVKIESKIQNMHPQEAKIETVTKIQSVALKQNNPIGDTKNSIKRNSSHFTIYDQLFPREILEPMLHHRESIKPHMKKDNSKGDQAKLSPKEEGHEKVRNLTPESKKEKNVPRFPTESKIKDKVVQNITTIGNIEDSLVKSMVDTVHQLLPKNNKNGNPEKSLTQEGDIKDKSKGKSIKRVQVTKSSKGGIMQTKGWTKTKAGELESLLQDYYNPGSGPQESNKANLDDNSELVPLRPRYPETQENQGPKEILLHTNATKVETPLKDKIKDKAEEKSKKSQHVSKRVTKDGIMQTQGWTNTTAEGTASPLENDTKPASVQIQPAINDGKENGSIPNRQRVEELVHKLKGLVHDLDTLVHTPEVQIDKSETSDTKGGTSSLVNNSKNFTEGNNGDTHEKLKQIRQGFMKYINNLWPLRSMIGNKNSNFLSPEPFIAVNAPSDENSMDYPVAKLDKQTGNVTTIGNQNVTVLKNIDQNGKLDQVLPTKSSKSVELRLNTPKGQINLVHTRGKIEDKLLTKSYIKHEQLHMPLKQPKTLFSRENIKETHPKTLPTKDNIKDKPPLTPTNKKVKPVDSKKVNILVHNDNNKGNLMTHLKGEKVPTTLVVNTTGKTTIKEDVMKIPDQLSPKSHKVANLDKNDTVKAEVHKGDKVVTTALLNSTTTERKNKDNLKKSLDQLGAEVPVKGSNKASSIKGTTNNNNDKLVKKLVHPDEKLPVITKTGSNFVTNETAKGRNIRNLERGAGKVVTTLLPNENLEDDVELEGAKDNTNHVVNSPGKLAGGTPNNGNNKDNLERDISVSNHGLVKEPGKLDFGLPTSGHTKGNVLKNKAKGNLYHDLVNSPEKLVKRIPINSKGVVSSAKDDLEHDLSFRTINHGLEKSPGNLVVGIPSNERVKGNMKQESGSVNATQGFTKSLGELGLGLPTITSVKEKLVKNRTKDMVHQRPNLFKWPQKLARGILRNGNVKSDLGQVIDNGGNNHGLVKSPVKTAVKIPSKGDVNNGDLAEDNAIGNSDHGLAKSTMKPIFRVNGNINTKFNKMQQRNDRDTKILGKLVRKFHKKRMKMEQRRSLHNVEHRVRKRIGRADNKAKMIAKLNPMVSKLFPQGSLRGNLMKNLKILVMNLPSKVLTPTMGKVVKRLKTLGSHLPVPPEDAKVLVQFVDKLVSQLPTSKKKKLESMRQFKKRPHPRRRVHRVPKRMKEKTVGNATSVNDTSKVEDKLDNLVNKLPLEASTKGKLLDILSTVATKLPNNSDINNMTSKAKTKAADDVGTLMHKLDTELKSNTSENGIKGTLVQLLNKVVDKLPTKSGMNGSGSETRAMPLSVQPKSTSTQQLKGTWSNPVDKVVEKIPPKDFIQNQMATKTVNEHIDLKGEKPGSRKLPAQAFLHKSTGSKKLNSKKLKTKKLKPKKSKSKHKKHGKHKERKERKKKLKSRANLDKEEEARTASIGNTVAAV